MDIAAKDGSGRRGHRWDGDATDGLTALRPSWALLSTTFLQTPQPHARADVTYAFQIAVSYVRIPITDTPIFGMHTIFSV
jgi:hypothetical protein